LTGERDREKNEEWRMGINRNSEKEIGAKKRRMKKR
jgi:hypothetical protein